LSFKKFFKINGLQWASSLAYNALLSLFPLILLFVTITSLFVDPKIANQQVLTYIQRYIPITNEMQVFIFDTISGVVKNSGQVSLLLFIILIWMGLQCFITLVYSINQAWSVRVTSWWSMSVKSLILLSIMLLIASGVMMLFWLFPIILLNYEIFVVIIQFLFVFISLSFFYKVAPKKASIKFDNIYPEAIFTTALLWIAASCFKIYLNNFASFNLIYETFGAIMALLLWIYLSGCIIIFGACIGSTRMKIESQ